MPRIAAALALLVLTSSSSCWSEPLSIVEVPRRIEVSFPSKSLVADATNTRFAEHPLRAFVRLPDGGGWSAVEETFVRNAFKVRVDFKSELPFELVTLTDPTTAPDGIGEVELRAEVPAGEHSLNVRFEGYWTNDLAAVSAASGSWPAAAAPVTDLRQVTYFNYSCPHVTWVEVLGNREENRDQDLREYRIFVSEPLEDATLAANVSFKLNGVQLSPTVEQRSLVTPSGESEYYISLTFTPALPGPYFGTQDLVLGSGITARTGRPLAGRFIEECSCAGAPFVRLNLGLNLSPEGRIFVGGCEPPTPTQK